MKNLTLLTRLGSLICCVAITLIYSLAAAGSSAKTLYFAGGLFSHKDLVGNIILADSIEKVSNNRYKCILPQNLQQISDDPKIIRDNDFLNLKKMDGIIASFDGTELDSGTVAEFMYAKFLNKPAVVFRSDFRLGGDNISIGSPDKKGYPWNLMLSNYPNTNVLSLDETIAIYHSVLSTKSDSKQIIETFTNKLASLVVKELDAVFLADSKNDKIDKFLKQNNIKKEAILDLYDILIGM